MATIHSLDANLAYLRHLVGAGFQGFASARSGAGGRVFTLPLQSLVWTPAAVGAAIGMLSTGLAARRKGRMRLAISGLTGSALGCGAALAWASRGFVGSAARQTAHQVNAVRDAHWLESHPIDYA